MMVGHQVRGAGTGTGNTYDSECHRDAYVAKAQGLPGGRRMTRAPRPIRRIAGFALTGGVTA
jgi:hypothetical protein